jgi:hypothetical protein
VKYEHTHALLLALEGLVEWMNNLPSDDQLDRKKGRERLSNAIEVINAVRGGHGKLVNGLIPAGKACPFYEKCNVGEKARFCRRGWNMSATYSCALARGFAIAAIGKVGGEI